MALPPAMNARPVHRPDMSAHGCQSTKGRRGFLIHLAEFGHFDEKREGSDVRHAGDRDKDIKPSLRACPSAISARMASSTALICRSIWRSLSAFCRFKSGLERVLALFFAAVPSLMSANRATCNSYSGHCGFAR